MTRLVAFTLLLGVVGCSSDPEPAPACAPAALRACVEEYSAAIASCFATGDGPCDDAVPSAALDTLQTTVSGCADVEPASREALAGQLRNACASEASSVAWRAFGGPQAAAWSAASGGDRECLTAAHQAATTLMTSSLGVIDDCLASDACDAAAVGADRTKLATAAQADVDAACSDLAALVAVDSATFVDRASRQVDCLTAMAHADTAPLDLRCGPQNAQFEAARGEWTQVVVDGDEWGTLCSDESPYAFYVRFAPEGEPLDRLVIGLQGGGVCLFEDDCGERQISSPGLFTAMDDDPADTGIMSDDPGENPFADYTKVFLPYCSQDVFAGGGVIEELGQTMVLPRYGAVNMRAAVQMVRDALWKKMSAEGDVYRPDELVALFGGWSAGGYGTVYNYHWFLDDLLWPRTSAFPDAGLALDNGSTLGVRGLGLVKIPVWGTQKNLPPYCFSGECAVGEVLYQAISPRLKRVPEQQLLIVSNPFDLIQQGDAFFEDTPSFINEMRFSYCETKDLNGINYYFTSVSDESLHVVSLRPTLWAGEVDGEAMKDWFSRAVTDADTVVDRVEEGDFTTVFPGVDPYPCEVAP